MIIKITNILQSEGTTNMEIQEEINGLKKQLDIHKKNLSHLELQKAKWGGLHCPAHVNREIEDEKDAIQRLTKEIERLKPEIQSVEPDSTPIDCRKLERAFREEYRLDELDYGHLGTTRQGEQLQLKLELQSVYVALKVKERTFAQLLASAKIEEPTERQQKNLPLLFQQVDELVRLEREKNQRLFETTEEMDKQLSQTIACKILDEANAENIREIGVIIDEIKCSHQKEQQQILHILQALSNWVPRPLAEIPNKARFHLLIGDAGAGKSTVCRYMALRCFEGESALQKEFGITDTTPLPVYLRLEDFGKMAADYTDGIHCLLACAANFWRSGEGSNKSELFSAGQLLNAINNQQVWLFLDGLDEIPNPEHRLKLVKIVQKIVKSNSFPQLRITLTSRPAAITNKLLDELNTPYFYILDLEQPQIEDFAHKYFAANLPDETKKKCEDRAQKFLDALDNVPAAKKLASNPLLLTVIAVLHYKEGKLPQCRAELYEECIKQLMAQKTTTSDHLISFKYPLINPIIELNNNQIIRVLRDLAFYAHQRTKNEVFLNPALLRLRLQESNFIPADKKSVVDMEQVAKDLMNKCDLSFGLLAFRGGHYVFVHRTFQEYLVAHWLSLQREPEQKTQIQNMLENPAHWQEVIRLFFNRLGNNDSEIGNELVELVNQIALSQNTPALITLSAQCLADFEESQPRCDLHDKIKSSLQQFRDKNPRQPQLFLASGDALGLMDEPKIDVANPPMVYFEPDKPFNMGSNENEREQPIHPVMLSPYWLGKYPVTNKEFGEFIKGGGYEKEEYWFDEESRFGFDGRKFLRGLAEKAPLYWLGEQFGKSRPLTPVVGVSWYEAMAYCRWWTLTWSKATVSPFQDNTASRMPQSKGEIMQLPTEAEWEFAARGFEGRRYPCPGAGHRNPILNE